MRKLTDSEKAFIADSYLTMTLSEMAIKLNRSIGAVHKHMKRKGLSLPADLMRQRMAIGHKNLTQGEAYRFTAGNIPANKGTKGLIKPNSGSFKKGHVPVNIRKNGDERVSVDGYIEVRVGKGEWLLKHRVVWKQENGEISQGYNIVFLDGNKLNCAIDNLRMVSNAELMQSNTIMRYPTELRAAMKNVKKLKRTIERYEKHDH